MSCLTPRSILPVLFCVLLCFLLAAGCTGTSPPSPAGQKTPAATGTIPAGATSLMLTGVPDVRQAENYSCGASSFQAVMNYYGKNSMEADLRTMQKHDTPPRDISLGHGPGCETGGI